jgi:hypothetical protein
MENDYATDQRANAGLFAYCFPVPESCDVEDGVLIMRDDTTWLARFEISNEFVWSLEITPKVVTSRFGFSIGWSDPTFFVSLHPATGDLHAGYEYLGQFPSDIGVNITSRVLVISDGDGVAIYLNDRPIAYVKAPKSDGTVGIQFHTFGATGSTEVQVDNVKFWRLSDLVNQP